MLAIPRGGRIPRSRTLPAVAVALLLAVAACGSSADTGANGSGQSPEQFYEGKTVRLVVPYDPGGGFDTYARTLAPYLQEELGTAEVTVTNRPGAGGLIGANEVYQSEANGLTLGLINFPGAVFAAATDKEGVEFDNSKWTFLGRVAALPPVMYTGPDSGYPTGQAVVSSDQEVSFAIGGVGSDAYYATRATAEIFGFPYNIVTGYTGSGAQDAAVLAGEVSATMNSIDSALTVIESENVNPVMLVSTERSDRLQDVTTIVELGEGEQKARLKALASIYDLERIMVAPPGIPEKRAAYLASALQSTLQSEDFAADIEEAGRTVQPMGREKTRSLAEDVTGSLDQLRPLLKTS